MSSPYDHVARGGATAGWVTKDDGGTVRWEDEVVDGKVGEETGVDADIGGGVWGGRWGRIGGGDTLNGCELCGVSGEKSNGDAYGVVVKRVISADLTAGALCG